MAYYLESERGALKMSIAMYILFWCVWLKSQNVYIKLPVKSRISLE